MSRVVIIDNVDSFVYNIAQYLGELGADIVVLRNHVSLADILQKNPDKIVLSPGPGHPKDSRVTLDVIRSAEVPVLGVCLGHQAIGYIFGAEVVRAERPIHGKTSLITHTGNGLFTNLPNPIRATRYHSLVIDETTLPQELQVTARTDDGLIMAIRHRSRPLFGVQFHPESILTQGGRTLLSNFLTM
ncbi:MAG: aminodeoxychorismate/anthranilate synthase component II [Candidatus Thorarchaeota archaeon]|nr:aminodeoxychorismate/anthranilate synthase component II [Candidatus Thorarchaeota archaeon]